MWLVILVDIHEVAALKRAVDRTKGQKRIERQKKLDKLLDVADEVKDLRVDYMVLGDERGYVCERKELGDMLGSLKEGRFFKQLENIKIEAEKLSEELGIPVYPILILEGSEYKYFRRRRGRLYPAQWYGILAGVAEMGVGLIKTGSFDGTILALQVLNKRVGKESKKYRSVTVKKEDFQSIDEEAVHVINVIKGVGVKKAVKLLEKYGSVRDVVMLDLETLQKELGKKTGEHVFKVFTYNFKKEKDLSEFVGGE